MASHGKKKIALIVRSRPFANLAARADLDFALAAAAMDFELEIYFVGDALLQLAAQRDSEGAMLPPGYRAWAALPDLVSTRVFAEEHWTERCRDRGISLLMPVKGLPVQQMSQAWRDCPRAMVL
jgi:sulfur relay (sulfurtransferase) DsrF/TusC family protein